MGLPEPAGSQRPQFLAPGARLQPVPTSSFWVGHCRVRPDRRHPQLDLDRKRAQSVATSSPHPARAQDLGWPGAACFPARPRHPRSQRACTGTWASSNRTADPKLEEWRRRQSYERWQFPWVAVLVWPAEGNGASRKLVPERELHSYAGRLHRGYGGDPGRQAQVVSRFPAHQ